MGVVPTRSRFVEVVGANELHGWIPADALEYDEEAPSFYPHTQADVLFGSEDLHIHQCANYDGGVLIARAGWTGTITASQSFGDADLAQAGAPLVRIALTQNGDLLPIVTTQIFEGQGNYWWNRLFFGTQYAVGPLEAGVYVFAAEIALPDGLQIAAGQTITEATITTQTCTLIVE